MVNFADLNWHRLTLNLFATIDPLPSSKHPLSVFEAICKGITQQAGLFERVQVLFHWPQHSSRQMRISQGHTIKLQIDVFGADTDQLQQWCATARRYFDPDQPGRNFAVQSLSEPVGLCAAQLPIEPVEREISLELLTPLPFKPSAGQARTFLTADGFISSLRKRIKKLFAVEPRLPDAPFELLSHYWHYTQIHHQSRSQPGHTKYLNGCVGRLYLKGELSAWLPWLTLAEAIGLGNKTAFGLGRLRRLPNHTPFFQARLLNPGALRQCIDQVLERYDDALPALSHDPAGLDCEPLLHHGLNALSNGWQATPNQAFILRKADGGERIVEKTAVLERILQHHLLAVLNDVMDRGFACESIGYRKGLSRDDAISQIQQAIEQGYDTVLESDVADFFPSVDLQRLQQRLDQLLPDGDVALRNALHTVLHTPRYLNGEYQTRNQGLAMGSPLSPLLANIYLDAFDQHIKRYGVKLVRYADDFIVLTQSVLLAETLLGIARHCLHDLGLRLNVNKTAIRPVREGFSFLGVRFDSQGASTTPADPQPLKKPLYITQHYAFLGLDGNSLEVRHQHQIVAQVPLKRISEILTLGPCSFSSALVNYCHQARIPIVCSSDQGNVITLTHDNPQRYQTIYQHMQKYQQLTDSEQLSVAQSIVQTKLSNYQCLLRQQAEPQHLQTAERLQALADNLWAAPDKATVRGIEGSAARLCFQSLFAQRHDGFVWQGRQRRPPDRLNSLLNLGYHLLFCRLNVLIQAEGLNPYLGFLHEANSRYEALVCDTQEAFRPNIDRLILRVLNLGMIRHDDFVETASGCWLSKPAKQRFLAEFAHELNRQPRSHYLTTLNQALSLQVQSLRGFLLEDRPLHLYQWRKP